MKEDFLEWFQQAGEESWDRAACETHSDPAFQEWNRLRAPVEKMLKEQRVDELFLAQGQCAALEDRRIYRQGFIDCVELLKWMKALS